jgi:hypothetical protein
VNYLPRLALNCNPPDLCLLSSWDCRGEHQSIILSSLGVLEMKSVLVHIQGKAWSSGLLLAYQLGDIGEGTALNRAGRLTTE